MPRVFLYALGCFLLLSGNAEIILAQPLQYDLAKDQKASYEYDIQVDTSGNLISLTGIVNYQVVAVNEQLVRLTFSGGLVEQTKPTTNREPSPGRIFVRPPLPAIFQKNQFTGKSQSKNTIAMNRSGQVLTLDGTSQLPFLLGNLSILPFEQLPTDGKESWKVDSGLSITDGSSLPHYTSRPFGPFAFLPSERIQLASEVSSYSIKRSEGQVVTVEKEYVLKTPDTGDRETFQMNGKGTWSFDTKDHLPISTDMQYTLNVKEGNTTTVFPIQVKFTKLSEERIAAMQAEAKASLEKSQKLFEERKAQAKAPIVGKELDELLSQLNSSTPGEQHSALAKLIHKENFSADPKLVEAVRKVAKSGDPFASMADSILQKLDPVHRINKQYEGAGFLESSNRSVDGSTDLFVGQIVQIREYGSVWYSAEISELLADGKVSARYRGWGKGLVTLHRNQVQLAHEEVVQPKRPTGDPQPSPKSVLASIPRTWTDGSGSFKLEATYIGIDGEKVILKKSDGKEVSVTLTRLSIADQRFVAQVLEESKKLGNPFEQ